MGVASRVGLFIEQVEDLISGRGSIGIDPVVQIYRESKVIVLIGIKL